MYIENYWGNYIGGSDDSLNLVAFLADQKKDTIPLGEIFAKIGLDKQNWDFRRTVEYLEFTHSNGVEMDFHFAIDVVTDLAAILLEYQVNGSVNLADLDTHIIPSRYIRIVATDEEHTAMNRALANFAQHPLCYDLHELVDEEDMLAMAEECENLRKELYESTRCNCVSDAALSSSVSSGKFFAGFDFSGFWDDNEYSLEAYVNDPPLDELIASVEKELGYKLPASYIWLMQHHNGGMPVNTCFATNEPTSWAENHIAITGIFGIGREKSYSLCGELGSQFMIDMWEYPAIGVAICDCPSAGHDMVFLDYRACGPQGEPSVVHVDQENDYKITHLADSFEEFIRGLKEESYFDASEEETSQDDTKESDDNDTEPSCLAQAMMDYLGCDCTYFPAMVNDAMIRSAYDCAKRDSAHDGFVPVLIKVDEILWECLVMNSDPGSETSEYEFNPDLVAMYRQQALDAPMMNGKEILADMVRLRREEAADDDMDWQNEVLGEMTGGYSNYRFTSYWNSDTGMTYPLILAKIPVKNPWEVFAYLPFGNWNECPNTPELMAAAKYWFEKYGAVPAVMTHDELEFLLPSPVPSDDAMTTALEQYGFCPDVVEQGAEDATVGSLADVLRQSTVWYFWWD